MSHGDPNNPYGQQPQQPGSPYGAYPQQPGMPGAGMPPGAPPLSGMGRRLGARLIDGVLFTVLYFVFLVPKFSDVLDAVRACDSGSSTYDTCVSDAVSDFQSSTLPIGLVFMVVVLLYEVLMVAFVGATLGKLAVGIRVLKAETGAKPGIGSSFLRWVIPTVGGFACGIGALLVYLSPFWDKSGRKQGWHDKVASTVVVHTKG